MDFYDLNLNDNVLDALDAMNFTDCTPIQEKAIPEILEGNDIIGVAQTGTGKTAAYLLPMLSKMCDGYYPKDSINCVIMSPTRELAQQIDQSMEGFSYFVPVSSVAVYGGNDGQRYEQERKGLAMGADVIIATPGRLISHLKLGNVDLSKVSFFILDEADRMLDMGFSDDIMKIASYLPKERQTIMFSATMPSKIQKLAESILTNPVLIKLAVSKPAEKIAQTAYVCNEPQKLKILKNIFKAQSPERTIIFAGSKQKVKEATMSLRSMHINVGEMHSDLDQKERDFIMHEFRNERINVLVATDIVARGIDINDIRLVINYDVPHDPEDYVHRIGRTARAGRDGEAITLVSPADFERFKTIEDFLETDIEKKEIEGLTSVSDYEEFKVNAQQRKSRPRHKSGSGRGRKDKPNNHRHPKSKPQAKTQEKPAKPTEAQAAPEAQKGDGAEQKKRKRRFFHHRKKSSPQQ